MGAKSYVTGFLIGAIVSGIGIGYLGKWAMTPKQAFVLNNDLNQDGVPDLIVEQRQGYNVPLFGINEGEDGIYVSGSEMMRRNPDSLIDYRTIELKLNRSQH